MSNGMKWKLSVTTALFVAVTRFTNAAGEDGWIATNTKVIPTTNSSQMLVVTKHEQVVMKAQVAAKIGGRVLTTYDCRVIPTTLNTNGMGPKEIYSAIMSNSVPFTAGYFRGSVDLSELDGKTRAQTGRSFPHWVTAFSSGDRKRLVISWDDGPISVSTNYGTSWQTITNLGQHEFRLSTTPKGSALVASISLGNALQEVMRRVAHIVNNSDWYLAATAADGTRLVVAGGLQASPPALSITSSKDNVVLSWSVECPGFCLQRKPDAGTGEWLDITNAVNSIKGTFQVVLPQPIDSGVFRLQRKP